MSEAAQGLSDSRSPSVWLITFSCYGQHLHGDERGSVDRRHNQPGTATLPTDEPRQRTESALMKEAPYHLDSTARRLVLRAVREACAYRGWILDACHVRTTHLHAVVSGNAAGAKMMSDFKVYASRALNASGEKRSRRWARRGSVRRIVGRESKVKVIRYVLEGQGVAMAVWPGVRSRRRLPELGG
jgi:REP element-mobilizing transposase RayT